MERVRRGRDVSWPLGWAAVLLQAVAFTALMNGGTVCGGCAWTYLLLSSWLGGGTVSIAAGLLSVADPHRAPGRGWMPAAGALVLMVGNFFVALGILSRYGIGPYLGPS